MSAAKEARYSLGGARSGSPTKAAGRRLSTADTASTRRPPSGDRPDERVKVFLRVRPPKAEGETPGALRIKPDGKGVVVYREHATIPSSDFEFDRVLGPSASQSDVYHAAVKPIVEDVLNGYNGTLMAYGQTGAGKTYSLSSIAADAIGMIPRAAAEIFSHIEQDKIHEYTVYMSYVQLYMELIQDLLRPESENLQIRENEGGVFVGGVHQQEVSNITQCLHLLHLGDRNRTTAFTALNAHSSRSHAVVMLTVIKRRSVAGNGDAEIQRVKVGKLFLVDLAGSERLKKSKSTGLRASEAKSINLSLTTLGMCINARADPNATHVPFRDSKLTRLLQDSLGGNAKTSLLVAACDAGEHCEETLQSLSFGQRAMCVRTQAVVNERVDYKTLHAEMIAALETQDKKSSLLEATLLEKDAQLEAVQTRLQQEQADAARRLEELQRERQALEAERARQLAEQQAALAAEQAHKQQLLAELEASWAAAQGLTEKHEAQRQELLAEVATQRQQLAAAHAAAAEAAQRHAQELEEQRRAAAAEAAAAAAEAAAARAAAQAAAAEQLSTAKEELGAQLAAAQEELARTQQLLVGSRAESRMLGEHHEQQLKDIEADWSGKVTEAQAAGECQLAAAQATIAARDQTIAQLQAAVGKRDDSINQLSHMVEALEAGKAELARQVAALQGELQAAHHQRRHAEAAAAQRQREWEAALDEERQLVAALQTQVEGYERSRMALAKSFFENKMRSDAAKMIQRHWRQYRLRRIRQQQTEGYQALNSAKATISSLAQQQRDLEQRRRANLAFSGQTLVGDNLNVLQEAVESIVAAFILPARDLKSLQSIKSKMAGGAARQSMALHAGSGGPLGPSMLSRTSTPNHDLIKAINPLAESLPNSARSTPRDLGADAPPPAAPLQQFHAAQQQYGGQLPPGPQLSRPSSYGQLAQQAQQAQRGPSREGSFRGGLAGLANKVMGSPMDRLRRLSSGHYQQQAGQHQPRY
ncbi:Kinesin-related 3 [Chlorella sorokiniana]|uniref:Kinesin-like protein n=1 Tax=Chlorella sorokiniana TaxID=3076 RepID=A0A2P6TMD4_CHLSO|nr:Kinesin-related 3 [Chlorella sorokiniana]|eukprot:PRW45489.1 Kinesin-related 3 [Chlorella sorokiniana]